MNKIHQKTINLKSQPRWVVRTSILLGAMLGGIVAFTSHPIGGTNAQSIDCPDGQYLATGDVCITNDKDIVIQATATAANQTLKINKYFANAYTVDRGDGTTGDLARDTTHTYEEVGIYNIILSLTGGASRWTFRSANMPLVPKNGTTVTYVKIIYMPSLADGFGDREIAPGNNFFAYFNNDGALTSLPEGSFDTSNITSVGDSFFKDFNSNGKLLSLPEGSFDTSNITSVGFWFFMAFNQNGALTSLPKRSFNLSGITVSKYSFFASFNSNGQLLSLPEGSFNTSNIITAGFNNFGNFNYGGALTSLPEGSFDTSNITSVGDWFFMAFNQNGALISLPEGSFQFSPNLTEVGYNFFKDFNSNGQLISLPEGSFQFSPNLTEVGYSFFQGFNSNGQLTSLPEGSFDTSNITSVGYSFFNGFNQNGALISLPEGSFQFSPNLTEVGYGFFQGFNANGQLTSLPGGSFDTSNITSVGDSFFASFNSNGQLTSLPERSFQFSPQLTEVGKEFFYYFNGNGALTSLPEGSFDTSNIEIVGSYFFNNFNSYGLIKSLPEGSFNLIKIKTAYTGFFGFFNYYGYICLPDSFYVSPVGQSVSYGYYHFNNSPYACKYKITYDSNDGDGNPWEEYIQQNSSIRLPNVDRFGFIFKGWYTAAEGGTRVNDYYTVTADITLYAHWEPAPKVRFLDGDEVIVDEEMYWNKYGSTDYGYYIYNLTFNDMKLDYDFEEYLSQKEGQIFVGRYKDKNLSEAFDFGNMTIEGDLDLYAKWETCPSGYTVVNNKCISSNAGVFYEDGYVEIRNGDDVLYIKDRNQGAGKTVLDTKYNRIQELKNEYNICYPCIPDRGAKSTNNSRGTDIDGDTCRSEQEIYSEMSELLGTIIDDSYTMCHIQYNDIQNEDEEYQSTYGTYYYRGNNNGATRDELGVNFDNQRANVSQSAIDRGFNGGVMGESTGWAYGAQNPCDPDEGEYLPTVDDWKDAMEIWSEIKGYDLDIQDYGNYGDVYYDSEFMDDILVPNAGYIYTNDFMQAYNSQNTKRNKIIDSLAMLFSSPVYAFDVGGYNMRYNNYLYLQIALSSGNMVGYFYPRNSNSLNYEDLNNRSRDEYNAIAAPVRCFIDSDYVNSIVKYTVTFDTKGGNETVPAQTVKEGKKLKGPATPTRDNYTFDGWYRSNGTKWIFDTDTVEGDMTLYAKWRLCGEGFVVENNKCIPEGMQLNGVIKVTDGDRTIYIRDRNVGVSDAAVKYLKFNVLGNSLDCNDETCVINKFNEAFGTHYTTVDEIIEFNYELVSEVLEGVLPEKEMEALILNMEREKIFRQCEQQEQEGEDVCGQAEIREYINSKFHLNSELQDWDDVMVWVMEYFGDDFEIFNERYNNRYYWDLADRQANGNYYYRGNNNGVSYNDLEIDPNNWSITNMDYLISKGFTEGKIGVEGQGWINGNPNPCDPDKGEYLPTPEDWKNLMQIWGNANGYQLEGGEDGIYNYEGTDYPEYYYRLDMNPDGWNKWQSDLLLPEGGNICEDMCRNEDTQQNDISCTIFDSWSPLSTSQDEEGRVGEYDGGELYYTHYNAWLDDGYGLDNNMAVPVRCFVNPAEIPDVYVVNYETNGGNIIGDVNVIGGDTVILPTPTKDNYTFDGWYTDRALTNPFTSTTPVTSDLTLYAKWTVKQSSSSNGGGGGGGGSTLRRDSCPDGDYSDSYYDGKCGKRPAQNNENKGNKDSSQTKNGTGVVEKDNNKHNAADEVVYDTLKYNPSYSDEMNQAYQYSYHYGITTKNNIKNADMGGKLTRIAMAKMLSQYAINVLGMKPDTTRQNKFNDVTDNLDIKYNDGVTLAYQLGIMGINMPNNEFKPYNYVTRGEFATAFSRMLYKTPDGAFEGTSKYYTPHISKLLYEGILTNTDPTMKELRGYVMLMLMRSDK